MSTLNKRSGNRNPRPKYGKTTRYTRLVRFVDLNEAVEDINFENSSLNTVEDLLNVSVESREYGSYFSVLGYNSPNDGGGGIFFWDPESEEGVDGGLILESKKLRFW